MPLSNIPVIGNCNGPRRDEDMLINAQLSIENDQSVSPSVSRSSSNIFPNSSDSDEAPLLLKPNVPTDRFSGVYVLFYLLGMATLLPWNFFITANGYWMYKLRDLNDTAPHNSTQLSALQQGFTSYLCITSLVPSTTMLCLNAWIGHKFSFRLRIVGALSLVISFFVLTTILVKVDTDGWQTVFYSVTLASAVLMNIVGSVFQGGLFALAGKFPARYMTAVVSGQALGGIFASVANIVSIALGASPVQSAFLYFLTADITLVIALILYMSLSTTEFFRSYTSNIASVTSPKLSNLVNDGESASSDDVLIVQEVSYRSILHKIWPYLTSVWLVYVVTLAVFPSVAVLVQSTQQGLGYAWNDLYFTPVACFLLMNVGDYVGRFLAGVLPWPRNRTALVSSLSVLRLCFVPLFMLCNAQPRVNLPVVFHHDAVFMVVMGTFSLSNGYLSGVCFMAAPGLVDREEQETASSLMAAFLGIGLATGGALSSAIVRLL